MKLRIITLLVVLALLVVGVVIVVTSGEEVAAPSGPTNEERANMTPEERARAHLDTLPDGDHQGRLLTIDAHTVTFRRVEVLRGSAAVSAAEEQGQTIEGDVYVRDTFQTVTLPVADDGTFRILDCANGCELAPTTLEALVSGEHVPAGGDNAVFRFTMANGTVVALEEINLQ